jgi:hypothetical protein
MKNKLMLMTVILGVGVVASITYANSKNDKRSPSNTNFSTPGMTEPWKNQNGESIARYQDEDGTTCFIYKNRSTGPTISCVR